MFDSGFLELLVVTIIALIVVGPERLPGIARKVGEMVGKARAFVATTKADIEKEIEASEMKDMLTQQKEQIDELRDMMASTKQTLNDSTDTLKSSVTDAVADAKSDPSSTTSETTDTLDAPNTNTPNTDSSDSSKSKA
jgi:sec-independent protein translocase protein TatB